MKDVIFPERTPEEGAYRAATRLGEELGFKEPFSIHDIVRCVMDAGERHGDGNDKCRRA